MKSNGWQILEVSIKCHIFIYTHPRTQGRKFAALNSPLPLDRETAGTSFVVHPHHHRWTPSTIDVCPPLPRNN